MNPGWALSDARGDGLKSIRETLLSVTIRLNHPLVAAIKAKLASLIEAPPTCPAKLYMFEGGQHTAYFHPRSPRCPTNIYARAFTWYFPTTLIRSHLASLRVSVVWRAFMPLAHRTPPHLTPPFSLNLAPVDVNGRKGRAVGTTPPTKPSLTWFHLKLPPSCPPSLPLSQTVMPPITSDTRAECDLLFSLPRPDADKETTRLARVTVSDACDGPKALLRLMESVQMSRIHGTEELAHELAAFTEDFLTLIALLLLNAYAFTNERWFLVCRFNIRISGGTILPGVSHGIRQSRGEYGGGWTESASEAVITDNHVTPLADVGYTALL